MRDMNDAIPVARRAGLCPACGHEYSAPNWVAAGARRLLGLKPRPARCPVEDLDSDAGWGGLPCDCADAWHGS